MYRDEVDGMRGLAVLSVILYHAEFSLFSGGYIGVDVFFVISGYLITSLILADQDAKKFSLIYFYERRVRRILPALYFCLFCCLPFAYRLMPLYQLKDFAQGLISVTICTSNILFWNNTDYFKHATNLNPLVHTWSLSIEEQFYIFLSLFFVLFHNRKSCIINIVIFMTILSLVLGQWSGNLRLTPPFLSENLFWFAQCQWASFYLPTGRIWEFLIGTLSAFYLHRYQPKSRIRNEIAAITGLSLIVSSIFLFDNDTPFPSIYTLLPTIGTMLIIIYGNKHTYIGRLLSRKLLAGIGLCSYSIYLCHQPLFAFARMSSVNELTFRMRASLIALSIILAYFSRRYVETPFRDRKKFSRSQIFIYAFTAGLIINYIAIYFLMNNGFPNTLNFNNDYLLELDPLTAKDYAVKRFKYMTPSNSFDKNSSQKRLVIFGDSFAQDFLNMAVENNKLLHYQIRAYYIAKRCQIYIGNEDRNKFIAMKDKMKCYKNHEINQGRSLINEADVLILASCWRMWSAERLPAAIQAMSLRTNQTLFVIGSKYFGEINPMLFISKSVNDRLKTRYRMVKTAMDINTCLEKNLSPTVFVNIHKMVCNANKTCPFFTPEGKFISFDGSHLTKSGARFIGNIIFKYSPLNILE